MRDGIPLLRRFGESGPYCARLLASTEGEVSWDRAAELMAVARDRVGCWWGYVTRPGSMPRMIPRSELIALMRAEPEEVWRWQETYRQNAHPCRHPAPRNA